MKTKLLLFNVLTLLAFAIVLLRGQGAGPLNPPGAPLDGVYRTLEEVYKRADSRTAIESLPFTINTPGSYFLASNLSTDGDGILIDAESVTLDLNGFTISSTALSPAGTAIRISSADTTHRVVVIKNGHIRGNRTSDGSGGGFTDGIADADFGPTDVTVRNVSVHGCDNGIALSQFSGALVTDCYVSEISATGITSFAVRDSVADDCGGTGISATIATNAHCLHSDGTALRADTATDCYASGGSTGSPAMEILGTATRCRAENTSTGPALNAAIAIGCTSAFGSINSPEKHLGTP